MPQEYTVRDNETGRTVTFAWNSDQPPTDADMQDVFAEAGQSAQAPEKSVSGLLGNIGSDIGGIASGLKQMALHPIDTVKSALAEKQQFQDAGVKAGEQFAAGERGSFQPGAAAQAVGDVAYEHPVSTALQLFQVGSPSASLRPMKAGLMRSGVKFVRGAQKAPVSTLNKMAGVKQMGLDVAADKVARTELSEGLPLVGRAAERTQGAIDKAVSGRDAAINAAPDLPVQGSGMAQLHALKEPMQKARNQRLPEADIAAVSGMGREMMRNPKLSMRSPTAGRAREPIDLTPRELNALNKGDNAALQDAYGMKKGSAELSARKAVAASGRESIEQAVPGTRGQGRRIGDLISLRNVQNMAGRRASARDTFGLTDVIGIASGHPSTLLATTAMRPAVHDLIGHGLYRTGAALPGTLDLSPALRALLLEQLLNPEPQP